METLRYAQQNKFAAYNIADAVKILYENEHHRCIVFSKNERSTGMIVTGVIAKIKANNRDIANINDQMLPSVYYWTAEDERKKYFCAEISMGKFSTQAELLHVFSEPIYGVLTDPNARKPVSKKALTTMAMIGFMTTRPKEEFLFDKVQVTKNKKTYADVVKLQESECKGE